MSLVCSVETRDSCVEGTGEGSCCLYARVENAQMESEEYQTIAPMYEDVGVPYEIGTTGFICTPGSQVEELGFSADMPIMWADTNNSTLEWKGICVGSDDFDVASLDMDLEEAGALVKVSLTLAVAVTSMFAVAM